MKRIITITILCLGAIAMFAQPALKVASNSNVGIGIDVPNEKLDVSGMITLSGPETGGSGFQNRNHVIYGYGGKKRLQFSTDESTNSSWAWIQMFGDETCAECPSTAKRGEMALAGQYLKMYTGNTNAGFGALAAELQADGDLYITGDVYAKGVKINSDKRLKKNIESFDLGLKEILQINPKQYEYNGKDGFKNIDDKHVGVIAQEMQKIVPQAVVSFELDDDRTNVHGEYLAVDENMIKFMLINAVKDQQEIIAEQSSRIDKLEKMIESIALNQPSKVDATLEGTGSIASLAQNTPNPFRGNTKIAYAIPAEAQTASINVFGQNGQLMKTIEITDKGQGTLTLEASNLPSGSYSYSLVIDGELQKTNKMIIQN